MRQGRRLLGLLVDPDAVLVGARRLVVPEAVALDLALGRRQRGEAGVAGGLPVDVFDLEPLLGVDLLVVRVEHDEAGRFESGALDVTHDANHDLSVRGQHVFTGPT